MFPEYDMRLGAETADNVGAVSGIDFSVIAAEYGLEGGDLFIWVYQTSSCHVQ